MNIRTVLVPVDYSTCSLLVTQEAAALAHTHRARVILLHVSETPMGVDTEALVSPDGVEVSAEDYLTAHGCEDLTPYVSAARDGGVPVRALVRVGPVVETILAAAEEIHADLIVMGTHGRSGLARVMLGSVAEDVLRHSDIPVLTIRRQPRPECAHTSCEWCAQGHRSPAEEQLFAEADG